MNTPVQLKQQKTQTHVCLGSALGIAQAREIYNALKPALVRGKPVVLDASSVERIDASILQLLTVFAHNLGKQGTKLKIKKVSDAFVNNCELLGVQSKLSASEC